MATPLPITTKPCTVMVRFKYKTDPQLKFLILIKATRLLTGMSSRSDYPSYRLVTPGEIITRETGFMR